MVNIDTLIEKEAPEHTLEHNNPHDFAYAAALRRWYVLFRYCDKDQLEYMQSVAHLGYKMEGATHDNVAKLVVIKELLGGKND